MYDKLLLLNSRQYIATSRQKIIERTADVTSTDEVDANRVFNTVCNDILPLLQATEQMQEDLKNS
jgi:hypothetical protein